MSFPALAWALAQRAPSSGAKFVLTVLADAASVGDWLAWPSVQYLAETTQQDRKSVLANLAKLKEAGLIEPTGKTGKTGQVVVWRLPVVRSDSRSKDPENGTVADEPSGSKGSRFFRETVPNFPPNGTVFPPQRSQKRDTEPVRDPVKDPVTEPESGRGKRAPRSHTVPLPDGFAISGRVRAWAQEKGFDSLEAHFEAFVSKAKAKGYRYADWDEALMAAIRADWAGLRQAGKPSQQRKGTQLHAFGDVDYSAGLESTRG